MIGNKVAISLKEVTKKFPSTGDDVFALKGISASIVRGSITGLIGPDGAGKTTLMRLMAGLLTLTQGQVLIEGLDPDLHSNKLRLILGYMPQKFGLYEDLTVIENLALYASLRGVFGAERALEFERLLTFTDLTPFQKRAAGQLSGGMKQKLGLACALLGQPKVLLLDEPSVGVDPIARQQLWAMVHALVAEGLTVVWSTAYLDEAERCDEVLLMNEGQLVYAGTPQAITNKLVGRSIQVQGIKNNHRLVLQRALACKEIMDGVIQGSNVRLLLREAGSFPALDLLKAGDRAHLVPVAPRFEDAFMDILGGGPGGESVLTQVMQIVKPRLASDVVIEARDLTKKFGRFTATDKISFQVKRGEVFGLLGPNGAGKSTTFKMMCGLLSPTSGIAAVLGKDLQKSPGQVHQDLGYMAQKFSLYGDLTVKQNLQFFSGIYGFAGKLQVKTMDKMVSAFDLQSFLNKKTNALPLGFKQRLALACAIMHNPAILFLDEPTSGVDPLTRREFWTHINGLVEKGVTVMVTTHYMDEAEYCDRIGLVYRGTLIAIGTPDQLKQQAAHGKEPLPTMEDTFIGLVKKHDQDISKNHKEDQERPAPLVAMQPSNKARLFPKHLQHGHYAGVRRWAALCKKEFYQIIRDPSSVLIAFILPMMMLFIFGFGINLDTSKIRMGLLMEDSSTEARHFAMAFSNSPHIRAIPMKNHEEAVQELMEGQVRGLVTIQTNFSTRLKQLQGIAPVQVIADGAEPNTANFVNAYAAGAWGIWQQQRGLKNIQSPLSDITIENRYWFNPAVISRYFLVPGSIAQIMTVIGALLSSLVIAREWERGTMEALLATPVTRMEFLCSKLVPYYTLGIVAMMVCTVTAVTLLDTPLRGSILLLFIESSLFLGSALGLGLLLSTLTRNQFNAAQAALNMAYLPAIMLSGFIFEISSMPIFVQAITYIIPARYFVSALQTLFLAGNIKGLLLENGLFLLGSALVFLGLTYKFTKSRLD